MEGIKQKIPNTSKSYYKINNSIIDSMKTKVFVSYLRCSTVLQSTIGDSIQTQESMIVKYCKDHSFYNFMNFYDEGLSGSKTREDRPGLDNCLKMLDNLKQKGFKCSLIAVHQDRLFRSTYQITPLRQYLLENNIGMYLMSMNCDVTKERWLEFEFSAVFANNERLMISERVKNNIAYRKIKGPLKVCTKFGEKKNPDKEGTHFVDEKEMEVVNYIRSLREENSYCKISIIREGLNKYYPACQYRKKSFWDTTTIERIIAYYNIPGAKPNYIYKKKNFNVDDETSG